MPKRLPHTPSSQIRSALRRVFLRSRERARTLKEQKYTCQKCGAKQSKAKGQEVAVECHHVEGVNWTGLIDLIRERLLAGELETLCKGCHQAESDCLKQADQAGLAG